MLNPKKRGSVGFEVISPLEPKLLKALHYAETFEPNHGCPTKNLPILEVNYDEDCDDLRMQKGCLDPKPSENPHDHHEFASEFHYLTSLCYLIPYIAPKKLFYLVMSS
jgi:hypothetical protein